MHTFLVHFNIVSCTLLLETNFSTSVLLLVMNPDDSISVIVGKCLDILSITTFVVRSLLILGFLIVFLTPVLADGREALDDELGDDCD